MSKKTIPDKAAKLTITPLTLKCEIIETFENQTEKIAKIKFDTGILELIIDPKKPYNLGDEVNLRGKLTIENIEQNNTKVILK